MKTSIQYLFIRPVATVDALLKQRVKDLGSRIVIEEARVRLEQHREQSPSYRVLIHLVTPGPDLECDARDHTLHAAINKAIVGLEERIDHRDSKRSRRVRSNLQAPAALRQVAR